MIYRKWPFITKLRQPAMVLLCCCGICAGAATENNEKQTMVVVLSFFSPVGREAKDSYGYQSHKNSGGKQNYPLPLFKLPKTRPAYGSREYRDLQRLAASAHLCTMKAAGFDTALYDMLPISDYDPIKPLEGMNEPFYLYQSFLPWLEAGERVGVKVGVFADVANQSSRYPKRREIKAGEWVNILVGLLDNLPSSPALWREDGKIGIMHFGTDAFYDRKAAPVSGDILPDGGWRQVLGQVREKTGKPFFFVADVRPHQLTLEWNKIADAAYIFAPAAPASFMTEYQRDISQRFTIPYYWFVSPGYYRPGTSFTMPEFCRIHDTYMAAMKSGANRIVVTSWNDMGEDHDIWPSANKGLVLLEVFSYYNSWFKKGEPPEVANEKILLCYPLRAFGKVDTKVPVWGNGKWTSPPFSLQVNYWALLKKPRRLEIAGAGSLNLPAGLSMGTVGTIKQANGQLELPVLATLDGEDIVLPPIKVVESEKSGGLQDRYLDLLSKPVFSLTGTADSKWELPRNPDTPAQPAPVQNTSSAALAFRTNPGIHNWAYLRRQLPDGALPPDTRMVKFTYRGNVLKDLNIICALQQPDGIYYMYDQLPHPATDRWTTIIVPLNHFAPAAWSAITASKTPDPTLVKYLNIGIAGKCQEPTSGRLEVKEISFLK